MSNRPLYESQKRGSCSAFFKTLSFVDSPLYTGMYKEIFNFIKKYQNDTIYF